MRKRNGITQPPSCVSFLTIGLVLVMAFGCQTQRDVSADLLENATSHLEENNLQQARDLAVQALNASDSESQRQSAQKVIDEAAARQNFMNRRVEELAQQSENALNEGDIDEARRLANRAFQIEKATNHDLAMLAVSRIDGFELGNDGLPSESVQNATASSLPTGEFSWADVVTKVKPGVVVIASEFENEFGTGTGFVIGEGLVVTNHHVICDPRTGNLASRVLVKGIDEISSLAAGFLYHDKSTDIAIIKLGHTWDEAKSLKLCRGNVRQGEEVAALGHPKGYEFSFSMGHVSAVRDAASFSREHGGLWVQHSAPISRGNSGGPLLNRRAEVVAMNSWYHDEGMDQNLNFAISSKEIIEAVRLSVNGRVTPFRAPASSASERALRAAIREMFSQ